ncbi:MAG TPA: BatD family protein [Cyclobacteriaceae bacterium]
MIKRLTLLFLALCAVQFLHAQTIQIVLGPDEIGENQAWTISVTIQNDRFKTNDYNFPDITGFRKRGTSSQSQTSIVSGQVSSSQSVVMTYLPTKQGTFTVPPFKMKINDQIISSPGKKVKVGAPAQNQRDPYRNFFDRDDFFGSGNTEFVDVKEDAFLALSTNKNEVYVGEGFTANLAFYVAESNRAPLQFYELAQQLSSILKKMKPTNCWEENFNIENIQGETVTINGQDYTQYKLYQATFYPFNAKTIEFPSIGLEMIKYKVAKNPSFFGQNRQENFKTFYSKPKTVKVKELPPHPLRDQVAVGNYKLDEKISSTALQTGQSFSYEFNVYGEGNISAIDKPTTFKDGSFDFYEPNIRQSINRENNRVTGTKGFSYFIIPKEPGNYRLRDLIHWIFFNPSTKTYDTLQAQSAVVVRGESLKNEAIESVDAGSFYDKIGSTDNTLHAISDMGWLKTTLNIFILVMLVGSAYLVFKK